MSGKSQKDQIEELTKANQELTKANEEMAGKIESLTAELAKVQGKKPKAKNLNDEERKTVVFLQAYANYVKDDVGTFPESVANDYVDRNIARVHAEQPKED